MDFIVQLAIVMIYASPFVLVFGLYITAFNKEKRKLGLSLVIGSIISFIIGFGICSSISIGEGH